MKIIQTFKDIGISWLESVKFFLPTNFKLFILVTLKAYKDMWAVLLKSSFFWIFSICALIILYTIPNNIVYLLLLLFFITICISATRPSIDDKNNNYFLRSIWGPILSFLTVLLLWIIGHMIIYRSAYQGKADYLLSKLFMLEPVYIFIPNSFMVFLGFALSPFIIFWMLFTIDSQKKLSEYIKAFGRALVMLVYNYPFCLLVYLLLWLVIFVLYLPAQVSRLYLMVAHSAFIFCILPLFICLITNFYIKRLHDQFKLYYR